MPNLYLPNSRISQPGLFYPGRKPVETVCLDAAHPLFAHIIFAMPFGGMAFTELTQLEALKQSGDLNCSPAGVDFNSTVTKLASDKPFPVVSSLTILMRIRGNVMGDNGGLASDKTNENWSGNEGISLNTRSTGGFLFFVGNAATRTDQAFLGDFGWHDIAFTWQAGQYQRIFSDGVEASYEKNSIASSYSQSSENFRLGTYYTETADRSFDGEMEFIVAFNSALSDSERNRIFENPYQFYRPLC